MLKLLKFAAIAVILSSACGARAATDDPVIKAGPDEPTVQIGSAPLQLLYVGINVVDLKRSTDFYRQVFGLKIVPQDNTPLAEMKFVMLNAGGTTAEPFLLLQPLPVGKPLDLGNGLARFVFKVPDVDKVLAAATKAGGAVAMEPFDERGKTVRVARFRDPDGYLVQIMNQTRHR